VGWVQKGSAPLFNITYIMEPFNFQPSLCSYPRLVAIQETQKKHFQKLGHVEIGIS